MQPEIGRYRIALAQDLASRPAKNTVDVFAIIREARERKKVAGPGRAVVSRRVRPRRSSREGMLLTTLRDPDEIRKSEDVFEKDRRCQG